MLRIVIPPRSRDPTSAPTSAGTASDGATLALRQQKETQQKPHLSQQPENKLGPHQPEQPNSQTLPHQQQLSQTLTQQLNQSTQPQKAQQQPQMDPHQTRKMDVGAAWTMANPKYKPSEPMLSEEALNLAGESCEGLHAYVMEQSANGAIDIPAKVAASYFDCEGELKLTVGFNDHFNLESLDVGLLRCWTL